MWDQLGGHFQDKQMAGTQIKWMSTAPDGRYAIMTRKGDCACLTMLDFLKMPINGC